MRPNWRRVVLLVLGFALVAAVVWVLRGAYSGPSDDPSVAMRCIGVRCGGAALACVRDEECKAWLACMQECGDDKMKCPTFCGAFYQSPKVTAFTECALAQSCIKLDFTSLPGCAAPAKGPLIPLEKADGVWWVAGIKGPDYVLFDDCQRFVLESAADGVVAHNSVPLTRNGETRTCRNEGKYTLGPDGAMRLAYENYGGYHEEWRFSYRSPNAMLAHVCSASKDHNVDYGTFVLSRLPLASLDAREKADLEAALESIYGLELGALTPLKVAGCPQP